MCQYISKHLKDQFLLKFLLIVSLFTFQMLSTFLVSPLKIPYLLPLLPKTPTSASWSCYSPILEHRTFTEPRASPPNDDQLGHPLLHIQLEPWIPPCVLFGWWFSPWDLWGYWLVHIVDPPMGLLTHLATWVLSLIPSLGTQYSGVVLFSITHVSKWRNKSLIWNKTLNMTHF